MSGMLFENVHIVPGFQSQTGAAIEGDWVCMKGYNRAMILIHEMRGADGTATVYAIDKAKTAAAGSSSDSITITHFWSVADVASNTGDVGAAAAATVGVTDVWTKGTAAAAITGSTTQSKGQWYAVELSAEELGDDYDWFQMTITSSNAAHYVSCWYILYEPRYARAGASQVTAIA